NGIPLFGTDKEWEKTTSRIVTDSKGVEAPKNPATCNVFHPEALPHRRRARRDGGALPRRRDGLRRPEEDAPREDPRALRRTARQARRAREEPGLRPQGPGGRGRVGPHARPRDPRRRPASLRRPWRVSRSRRNP